MHRLAVLIPVLFVCMISSCTSESKFLHDASSAAYQEVYFDADGELFMIATKVFHQDGTVQSSVEYPPIVPGATELEWELDSRNSVVTITSSSGAVSEYEYAAGELIQVSNDGEDVEIPSQLAFVGSPSSAQERADSIVSASFPGGVASSTAHHDDVSVFYDVILRTGFSPYVYIYPEGGREHFVASYDGCFLGSEAQWIENSDRILAAFVAAGLVSAETSWSSSDVIVLFEDYGVTMSTYDARYMVDRYDFPLLLKFYPKYYGMMWSAGADNYYERGLVQNEIERQLERADEYRSHSSIEPQEWAMRICSNDGINLTVDEATELGYYLFYRDYCWRTDQYCYYDACQAASGMSTISLSDVVSYQDGTPYLAMDVLWLAGYPATVDVVCQGLWDYIDANAYTEEL